MTRCTSCRVAWAVAGLAGLLAAGAVVGLLGVLAGERSVLRALRDP